MGVMIAAVCAASAVFLLVPRQGSAVRRLRAPSLTGQPSAGPRSGGRLGDSGASNRQSTTRNWLLTLAVGAAIAAVVGGVTGIVAGAGAALLGGRWLGRRHAAAATSAQRRLVADVPLTADLLAACLTAGAQPETAAEAVAAAVGGEIGGELRRVTATLRLGGEPETTWMSLAANDALAPLGRAFARAANSGASLSAILAEVAEDARRQRRIAAETAARRVGVHAAAPLGLCFLPAFVLLAIVPVIAGLVVTITPAG